MMPAGAVAFGILIWAVVVAAGAPDARLRITHRDLVPVCLSGKAVPVGTRSWELAPGSVSLVLSIRGGSRPGQSSPDGGTAAISFVAERDHKYEVEVRADRSALSTHTWRKGEWKPVVRDRTTETIVSADPAWVEPDCR